MNKMRDILVNYKQGNISKNDYIDEMHRKHQCLFEYSSFMRGTNIEKIEITDNVVTMTTRDNNIKLICDIDDKRIIPIEILNFGDYEQECMDMMLRLIKPGYTVLDIGANIGWYSINLAKRIKNIKIYAFEPIPKTFNYLTRNIEINEVVDVDKYNFGLSDEDKELIFYYDCEGSGNSSITNLSEKENIQQVQGKVITLDHFIESKNISIDFIKCDVEGAELLVLKGGEVTLKKYKPIIFTEMLRKWAAKFNYHPNQIIELLKNIGYRCFTIAGSRLEEFYTMDEQTIETNFIFLHGEKHCDLIRQSI